MFSRTLTVVEFSCGGILSKLAASRFFWMGLGTVLGLVGSALTDWTLHCAAPARAASDEPPSACPPSASNTPRVLPTREIKRAFTIRPVDLFVARDAEAERRYQLEQSKGLVDLVKTRASLAERFTGREGTEAAANQVDMYVLAWTEVAIRTAPDLAEDIADQLETSLCDPESTDTERVVIARLIARAPELANARGLECLIEGRGESEDIVLWEALNAWSANKEHLPASAAIEALSRRAVDKRTTALLADIHGAGVRQESGAATANRREQ